VATVNKKDRKRVDAVLDALRDLRAEIDDLRDNEDIKIEGLPDSLAQSQRGSEMQEAAEALADAIEHLDSVCTSLEIVSTT
jgi:hypothetical protein